MARSSRAVWQQRVAQWTRSGASGAEFAARLGVKEATLRHWKWQLAHEGRGHGPTKFIEVVPAIAAAVREAPAFELLLGDRALRIPVGFDEPTLRRLLSVLEAE